MKRAFKNSRHILLCIALIIGLLGVAHEGEEHKEPKPATIGIESISLQKINEMYLTDIKPIFQKSCFACHTSQTIYPWYSKIPGAKQLIEHDVTEAKVHLDMEFDFPFKSHATPIEDLKAISDSIAKNEMPPFRFRIMHSEAKMSDEEKSKIQKWILYSQQLLETKK